MAMKSSNEEPSSKDHEATLSRRLKYVVDLIVKLTVPAAAVAAALFANKFEERESLRTLVSQREQADTNLRATMFGQLVSPIVGDTKGGPQSPDPVRYALLVKLLALNFHEHFEFGPLMQSADDHLAASGPSIGGTIVETERGDLRSVAHRIINRQISSLGDDPVQSCQTGGVTDVTFWVFRQGYPDADYAEVASTQLGIGKSVFLYRLGRPSDPVPLIQAPNCKDALTVAFSQPDWERDSVDVQVFRNRLIEPLARDSYEFRVTPFSFPYSDNTLLEDGNRFTLYEKDVLRLSNGEKGGAALIIKLRWFPQFFYPPAERPSNGKDVQQKLGLGPVAGGEQ